MNTGNKGSRDTGHQATKYSDVREMGRKRGILKWFNLNCLEPGHRKGKSTPRPAVSGPERELGVYAEQGGYNSWGKVGDRKVAPEGVLVKYSGQYQSLYTGEETV